MERQRVAAWTAAAGSVGVGLLLLAPLAVADANAVGVYYGQAAVTPLLSAVFLAVAVVAVVGARRGTADPPFAAGVAVACALGATAVLAAWAVPLAPDVVGGLTDVAAMRYHRWALVLASLAATAGFTGYAARATAV